MIRRIKQHSSKGWIVLNETEQYYSVIYTNQVQQHNAPYNRRKDDTVICKVTKEPFDFTFDKPWSEANKRFQSANFKEF